MIKRGFASDNNSGVSIEVIDKLTEVNTGHEIAYGEDPYTKRAELLIKKAFGEKACPFFVFTGTAANVLSIASSIRSFQTVFCSKTAHINEDECGAPEHFTGSKLISLETTDGKLTINAIEPHLCHTGFEHHVQPGIISISQSTELGTVYSPEEIHELAEFAHNNAMYLHMDGARLANAAVSLNCSFKEMVTETGVDILSFGGTKNGLLAAESVVFFKEELSNNFKYIRKQGMQLASKMRYIAAQFIAYFENDLWYRNALHANQMAQELFNAVKDFPHIEVTQKVESNGVFAIVPKEIIPRLQEEYFFYVWDENRGEVRWMTSFDTTSEDIRKFSSLLKKLSVN